MLNSKFDLYKIEWLDLVFENRNKAYGAYDLRKHNGETTARALAITTFAAVAIFIGSSIIFKHAIVPNEVQVVFHPMELPKIIHDPVIQHPKVEPQRQTHVKAPQLATTVPAQPTIKYTTPTITTKPITTELPTTKEIASSAVGPETAKGQGNTQNVDPNAGTPGGSSNGKAISNDPVPTGLLEVMPMPAGGMEGWSRFLQKNLRYPNAAKEDGINGRVWVSFVVEKDGHITDIKVIRSAGHGFDEEAVRVLKMAPAWSAGIQNGQKVRVQYTLPFNFQLSE
jgi:protein TonB